MKQIKVELTPREWAEKRMQFMVSTYVQEYGRKLESIDTDIEQCGFVLKEESETKPEQTQIEPAPNEQNTHVDDKDVVNIPTDKVEAVKYFLNQLPSGYKERALAQVDEGFIEVEPDNICDAISFFYDWSKTKEDWDFWYMVYLHYYNPTKYSTLPPLPKE